MHSGCVQAFIMMPVPVAHKPRPFLRHAQGPPPERAAVRSTPALPPLRAHTRTPLDAHPGPLAAAPPMTCLGLPPATCKQGREGVQHCHLTQSKQFLERVDKE